jgi:hypothetical protein
VSIQAIAGNWSEQMGYYREKESYKWWQVAQNSQRCRAAVKTVTDIADREADINELWEQTPKLQSHALW